jgi:beta-glucanase (GH16 family)
MKKISLILVLLLAGFLASCGPKEETEDPIEFDDRSLVTEECALIENIDEWQPVWCDEFDTDGAPSSDHWGYDVGGSGWGNNELQYYTNTTNNAYVEDGLLHIKAIKESVGGREYTSARMVSKYYGDWAYGRVEIKAKMPSGRGLWSALWMLPTNWEYGGWPDSGEIDIMEYVGYDKNAVYGTIHTGAYNHGLGTQIGFERQVEAVEDEFHIYEMVWEPARIDLYIDGVLFAYFGYNPNNNLDKENSDAWPFDQAFHLIMNIAVGGDWGGSQGVDTSIFPQTMQVDYVRVYQKDYAGMDQTAPSDVKNLTLMKVTDSTVQVKWDHASDDVMVKEYDVYLNDELYGTTTVNGLFMTNLLPETVYEVKVVSKDFKDQVSEGVSISAETDTVPDITGQIEAEDYVAMSGINTEETSDIGGGLNVGWIDTNDSLEYMLNVPEDGTYTITYRIASQDGDGEIKLYGKSSLPLVTTSVPLTGDWQNWEDVESTEFTLQAGVYRFTIKASEGGFNLNYFLFKKVN